MPISYQLIYPNQTCTEALVEGIITINKPLSASFLLQFSNLKFVTVAFTGYDSVDLAYCKQAGIAVYNVPTYATNSVAELTLGTVLSFLREIHIGNDAIRKGQWDLGHAGIELAGKKVGIVGTGRIGTRVAELFKAFQCEVLAWSRTQHDEFAAIGTYVDELKDLCAQVDILCLHLPLNEHTKGLIGVEEFKAMKSSAFLINMARGPVVQEAALVNALNEKIIVGAAIDVFDQEPIDENHPLCQCESALLTPHVAYKTNEALLRRAAITFSNIQTWVDGGTENRVL